MSTEWHDCRQEGLSSPPATSSRVAHSSPSQTLHEDGVPGGALAPGSWGREETWQGTEKDVLEGKLTLALVRGWEEVSAGHGAVGAKTQR